MYRSYSLLHIDKVITSIPLADVIRDIRRESFITSKGDRKNVPDLLIFISDRTPTLAKSDVIKEVELYIHMCIYITFV